MRTHHTNIVKVKKGTPLGFNLKAGVDTTATIIKRPIEKPTDYEINAGVLMTKMDISFKSEFLHNAPYFEGDTQSRDIYQITLSRKNQKDLTFKFGNSLNDSAGGVIQVCKKDRDILNGLKYNDLFTYQSKAPSIYSVLASIEKYEVEPIFEDWADEYGYDSDSIKARDLHQTCLKQYRDVSRFFSNEELELLKEIN